ncbi:thiamine diphosphokinase [Schnuerera sp. xch1]|uniref:thiamine diphosphokinase n=1 Tax=Schnuerera sp. xch1 TaxID=2874283 RepID=UPI001CBE4E9A|nr:thiamine diphosphokinase [Schnuerera sp. xch1]MBZ2173920.1 thiamine diphosphokinase [Schnuerera sp. xch1]
MKALIILHGDVTDLNLLKKLGEESDFILSADGGTDYCIQASLYPDLVMGDLDSISKDTLNIILKKDIPIRKFPVKKDETDSELSIDYLIKKGATYITLIGATGNRLDHTLANIYLLSRLNEKGVEGKIIDGNNTIYLVDDELILPKEKGTYISVVPIVEKGIIVSLKGFEYELDKAKIDFGSSQGISNSIVEPNGFIKVHEGKCLIFVSRD